MSLLAGKRIVITRAPHQSAEMAVRLHAKGALSLLYPCIDIAPPTDTEPLDAALRAAHSFDWLILTSTNTVQAITQRLEILGLQPLIFNGLRVAVVGPATAQAVNQQLGLQVNVIPDEFTAEALADTLQLEPGARVLLPQSAIAEPVLATTLSRRGAFVTTVDAYRSVIGTGGDDLPSLLVAGEVDVVTLTSSSTVINLLHRLEAEGGDVWLLNDVCIACIGPKTAATARENQIPVTLVPVQHTLEGLLMALEHHFSEYMIRGS